MHRMVFECTALQDLWVSFLSLSAGYYYAHVAARSHAIGLTHSWCEGVARN